MIEKTYQDLEFSAILGLLHAEAATPLGAARALAVRPDFNATIVRDEQALTVEALDYLEAQGRLPFGALSDPEPILRRLALPGNDCEPAEVLEVLRLMKAGREVKSALALHRGTFRRLWGAAQDLPDLGNLVRFLDGKIGPQGDVLDHASDDLMTLRRELRRAATRLEGILTDIVKRPEIARALQDDFVALRSERHVIPIRSESRSSIAGIVHGVSGSGQTVFVEPLETIELNNEIVTLRELEAAEVRRLVREYSDLLRGRLPEILALVAGLGRLDLVFARARLARSMRATPASFDPLGGLLLRGARHPLVEASLVARGTPMVPLDLELQPDDGVLLLSGPNTGGKTVVLKTIGLLALMHQSGLLVPAREAAFPLLQGVFIDIGDRQSIQDGLSTFSARIRNIAAIAREIVLPCLILLDEVGTGTDPEAGVALGIAVIDHFRALGARVIATTHLEALKAYAATTAGCSNAAMQCDERTGEPTYALVQGIPGRSNALEIAARCGLPESILQAARERRGAGHHLLETYLSHLESLTAEAEQRVAASVREQERLASERAAMEAELRARDAGQRQAVAGEITRALGAIQEEGERYLVSLKDREVALRLRREEEKLGARLRAEARQHLRAVIPSPPETGGDLAPGARVRLRGLGVSGTVESTHGGRVTVSVRGKRVVVPREECEPPESRSEAGSRPALPSGVTLSRRPGLAVASVDLRGVMTEEAIERVDKFLDDASLEGLARVRIVHGVGSGRLRQAIHEMLDRHLQVQSFDSAPEDEGGAGATVVTMRS